MRRLSAVNPNIEEEKLPSAAEVAKLKAENASLKREIIALKGATR